MLSAILNILTILLVWFTFYISYKVYEQAEESGITSLQVYRSLIDDLTAASVTRALATPKTGDVGSFVGYDYDISKRSGVGGVIRLSNPIPLSLTGKTDYIGGLDEGRPSIVGLT